jgi:hypothetical protein
MSANQPTLFGAYPWADGSTSAPTLYGSGYTPQTYSVALDDAVTDTEAELFSTTKVLSDSATLTEAQVMAITQVLADSETVTEAVAMTVQKVFAETGTIIDSNVVFTIKDLQDFLILKEWISIRLNKSITWVNPSTNANVFDTLWGKYQFGRVLFGGLKPLASWSRGSTSRRPSVFTNENGHKYNS